MVASQCPFGVFSFVPMHFLCTWEGLLDANVASRGQMGEQPISEGS